MTKTESRRSTSEADDRAPMSWATVAKIGASTIVVWSVALQLIAGEPIPPVAVIGVVFLAFAPFIDAHRRKLGLALAIVAVLAVGGNLPPILDELSHPESAPAFILTLLSVLGAVMAFMGGLGIFFGWNADVGRRLVFGAALVFVIGAFTSVSIAANTVSDGARSSDVEVVTRQVAFDPTEISIGAEDTGIWVDNRDGIRHTFSVPELGIDLDVPALKSRRVDIDAAPGTYEIFCEVPGHESMTATLTVTG